MKRHLLFLAILGTLAISSCSVTGEGSTIAPSSEAPVSSETTSQDTTSETSVIESTSSSEQSTSSSQSSSSSSTSSSSVAPTPQKFVINWLDEDGTLLDVDIVDEGETPSYKGETPTKKMDATTTYKFDGWDPAVTKATADAEYTAKYKASAREYTIAWNNYDGTELKTDSVKYGETPEYTLEELIAMVKE